MNTLPRPKWGDSQASEHESLKWPSVVLSAIGKFHIWSLAKELNRRNLLQRCYTGYPSWKLDFDSATYPRVKTHSFLNTATLGLGRFTSRLHSSNPLNRFQKSLTEYAKLDFGKFVAKDIPECDVFHGMSQYSLEAGVSAKRKFGALFVLDVGSSHVLSMKKILETEQERLGISKEFFSNRVIERELEEYEQADVITVPSKFAAQTFIENGVSADRIEVNVLGVDLSRFYVDELESPKVFTVTFIGALSARKGLHILLEGFRLAAIPRAELLLIGTAQAETRKLMAGYESENIRVVGRLPHSELRSKLSQSSVFALPSIEDGFGMVILEALASGCPVIATDHTGGPDVIRHGVDGYIIPSGDSVALAEAMVRLYKDEKLLQTMRQNAGRRAKEIGSWDNYANGVVQMYRRRVVEAREL